MKSSSWQREEIQSIIRILPVTCAQILDSSKDVWKTAAETASDEIVMGTVQALCEFSLHVSQQNHSDVSLTAPDDPQKRFYKKEGAFREQTMSKSAKAKEDEQFTRESHQLRELKIHKICAAMEVQVYRAEMVTVPKQRQFQMRQNRT